MIILADHLAQSRPVSIFEERPVVGGAWSQVTIGDRQISSKTNILVPLEPGEEPFMAQINALLLRRFGVAATPSLGEIRMLSGYAPQNRFRYDFQPLFASLAGASNLVTNRIIRVVADSGGIEAGGRRFARMYLPYFCGIETIEVDGIALATPFTEIISEHLLLILDGKNSGDALYCEDFNEVFDRVQIKTQADQIVFTGRVGRSYKGKSLDWLTAEAAKLFPAARVAYATVDKYRNCYRNEEQLAALQAAVSATSHVHLVNTSQFVAGFISLLPLLQDEVEHD